MVCGNLDNWPAMTCFGILYNGPGVQLLGKFHFIGMNSDIAK